ncbi:hypothetical protein ACTXLK_06605 [Psychrobacter faecalis]
MTNTNNQNASQGYAYLPEDLLLDMLHDSPEVVKKLIAFSDNSDQVEEGRAKLEEKGYINKLDTSIAPSESLVAIDGATIIEKLTSCDLLMSIAVGVEGVTDNPAEEWTHNGKQYYSWQDVLPHHPDNTRLAQGIMFLMELSILANADHEFRIMDGSHITSIMKLNSLMSAKSDDFADESYAKALQNFLQKNYSKVIPDIPTIIKDGFQDDSIVALTKYSSSRELLDSVLEESEISGDDKSFMSLVLGENEYTIPLPVGQADRERNQWNSIHIKSNLDLTELHYYENGQKNRYTKNHEYILNQNLEDILYDFKPKRLQGSPVNDKSDSKLYFFYFKPNEHGVCYRVEVKESLAKDTDRLQRFLMSLKNQIFFPDIQEPYPQFLADVIAKNISFGMEALKSSMFSSPELTTKENLPQLLSYRS